MAELELSRATGYKTDRLRAYQIYIDGQKVSKLKPGETDTFTLSPGRHKLQLKQDWTTSEKLQVDLGDNDRAQFVCAPRIKENDVGVVSGLRMIYWSTLGCRRYIDLRQGDDFTLVDEPNSWLQKFDGLKLFGIALAIGIVFWVLTGQSIVTMGVMIAAAAIVVSGLVARGIGNMTVQVSENVQKHRDD
jgi:hypothetical protein